MRAFAFESTVERDGIIVSITVYCNLDDDLKVEDMTAERSDDCQDMVLSGYEEVGLVEEVPDAYYDAHNPRF